MPVCESGIPPGADHSCTDKSCLQQFLAPSIPVRKSYGSRLCSLPDLWYSAADFHSFAAPTILSSLCPSTLPPVGRTTMLSSNVRGTNGGGRIPLSNIVAGLPPLRMLKAANVDRRSGFYRSGTVSPSVGIVVLLLFPSDRGRSLTTPFSRRENARQVASGTSFRKVKRRGV